VSRASIRFRAFHTFSTAQKCPYFLSPMAGRKPTQRIDELEDEIKHRDRRIEELRCEIDELRDLVRRMEEDVEDAASTLERWKETFDMVEVDGGWSF
jgi:uncharacterized coiled-coil protein SlyX